MNNPPPPSQSPEQSRRRAASPATHHEQHSASTTNDDAHHYPLQYPPPPPQQSGPYYTPTTGRYDHYRDIRHVAPVVSSPGHRASPPELPPISSHHHHHRRQYHHLLATETASDSSSGDCGSPDQHRSLAHNDGVNGSSSRDDRDSMVSSASWPLPPLPSMSFDLSSPSLTSAVERMAVTGTSSSSSSPPTPPTIASSSSSGPLKKRRKIFENEDRDDNNNNNVVHVNTSLEECDRRDEKNNETQHDGVVDSIINQDATMTRDHADITDDNNVAASYRHHHHHHHKASFPIILHELLTVKKSSSTPSSSYSNEGAIAGVEEAMEWLPHGKGFRILRWEKFVQNILPCAFPTLCDCGWNDETITAAAATTTMDERGNNNTISTTNTSDDKESKCSDNLWVDSFLWHMTTWGFREVTIGIDRGSFCHEMFIKESPNLCKSMRMIPQQPTLRTPSPSEMPMTPISSSLLRNAKTPVSSIYKPPKHFSVPILQDTNSYQANNFRVRNDHGQYQQQQQYPQHHYQYPHQQHYPHQQQQQYHQQHHFPLSYPQPPPTFRSARTIRFIDEQQQEKLSSSSSSSSSAAMTSDAVEITPNSERNPKDRKKLSPPATAGCTVSKRGRRPTVISRHASH